MNHPSAKCVQFFEELIQISEALKQDRPRYHRQPACAPTHAGFRMDVDRDGGGDGGEGGDVTMDNNINPAGDCLYSHSVPANIQSDALNGPTLNRSRSKYHVEVHPGAAQTYGKGSTFMDGFDGDKYASMQKENLYYLWASPPEWELAAFLLRLSLSMAEINKFLSLDLVSLFMLSLVYDHI